jgi:predicted alpha/beta hydrolase family esterase
MKNALILHGAGNDKSGNWFPWLKEKLEEKGYKVWVPDLPNSSKPIQKEWIKTIFSKADWKFDEDSIIIGHSAGATLLLRILEKLNVGVKINQAILVACPIDKGKIPDFWPYKEDLTKEPFNWENIKKSSDHFVFIASDNDPYDCGERHAKSMYEKLGGNLFIQNGEGHFNLEVGDHYKQFPFLLNLIK